MRLGTLCPLDQLERVPALLAAGFEFIEMTHTEKLTPITPLTVPMIWQCPSDLPAYHENSHIRAAILQAWRDHLAVAKQSQAVLMVVQFHNPTFLPDKTTYIEQWTSLLQPLTSEARAIGIQIVLRNSPDNQDQLKLLREIVRRVPGLALAVDIAYAHHKVIKNLTPEYLMDSDLSVRIAHVYASETTGQDASLRLPLGCLGDQGIEWGRLVHLLRQRYNASVTLDPGTASQDYVALSREKWLAWWHAG
jgi:sugar phosphate isomerase/epimerase